MAGDPATLVRRAPVERLQPGGKVSIEKLNEWWREAKQAHEGMKRRWRRMREFYYGDQWKDRDKQKLNEEHRAALVHNFVAPTVNLVIGTERRNRLEPRAYGRGPSDVERALTGTKVIKFTRDQTNAAMAGSASFEDAVISGLGATVLEVQEDDPDIDVIFVEKVDIMRFYWDVRARRWDLSDAAYMFEEKWLLGEELATMFPERKRDVETLLIGPEEPLTGAGDETNLPNAEGSWGHYGNVSTWSEREQEGAVWADPKDKLIRVVNLTYLRREPVRMLVRQGERTGPVFDPTNLEHLQAQIARDEFGELLYTVVKRRRRVIYRAIFSGTTVFYHEALPYEHRQYPYVFRRWLTKDNGEPVGIVGNLLDPQDELNKQISKALDILVSEQALIEEGAVKDLAVFAAALADPRGVAQVRPGALKRGAVQLRNFDNRIPQHLELANVLIEEIRSVAGTPRERMGGGPGQAASAIALKIEQGDLQTAFGFDNLRLAVEREGEIILSLAKQFYPPGTWIRVTEDPRAPEYVQLGADEGSDIYEGRFDVKVDAQAATATFRQALFQQMLEVANNKGLPLPVVLLCLKTAFDNSDIPDRQALVGTLDTMFQATMAGMMAPPNLPAAGGMETGDALPGEFTPGGPPQLPVPA